MITCHAHILSVSVSNHEIFNITTDSYLTYGLIIYVQHLSTKYFCVLLICFGAGEIHYTRQLNSLTLLDKLQFIGQH